MRKIISLAISFAIVVGALVVNGQGTQTPPQSSKTAKPKPSSEVKTQTRSRKTSEPAPAQTATTPEVNETLTPTISPTEATAEPKPTASPAAPGQSPSAPTQPTPAKPPATDPEKAKAHVSQGEAYLKESRFQKASVEFKSAIQIDEKLAAAHWGLVRAYEGLQRYQEMVDELRRTIELDPNNLDARLKLGNIYLAASKGRPEIVKEAERLAQEVLTKDPNYIEGHILLGSVLYTQKENEKALAELNRAIELDPKRVESQLALAKFYVVSNENEKAEQTFKKAIEVNPNSAVAHMEYGRFLVQRNRPQEAEGELRKAVEVVPTDRQARFVLASFYLVNKQLDKAEVSYKALAELNKDRPEGRAVLADFYAVTNRMDEAISIYRDILAKSPNFSQGRERLDELLRKRSETQSASTQFEEALKKDAAPAIETSPVPATVVDPVMTLRDQIDAAETPQERVQLQLKLADHFVANGKKEEALAELHRVASTDVFAPQDIYNAGNSLARLGDMDGAILAYRKAIEQRNGNYSRAYNNLGVVLMRAGKWQESHEALTSALRIENFRYAEAGYNLGRLYATRNENDLAIREWKRVLSYNPNHSASREALARLGKEGTVEVAVGGTKLPPPPRDPKAITSTANSKPQVLTVDRVTYDYLQQARTSNERGKFADAINSYKRAISSNGGYLPPANLELSYVLVSVNRFEEALENLLLVTNRDGEKFPISYFHLARLYEMRGELKQAETAFAQAAAVYKPTNYQFLLDISRVREKQGDFQGALQVLEQYVDRMKQQGETVNWSDERIAALRLKINTPK